MGWTHTRNMDLYIERELAKITNWRPSGGRIRGKPKDIWEDHVLRDIRSIGIEGRRDHVKIQNNWRHDVKKARTHKSLLRLGG